jgi:hypothetical protein
VRSPSTLRLVFLAVFDALTFLFSPQRIRLIDSGRRRTSELFLQLLNAILGGFELLLGVLKLSLARLELSLGGLELSLTVGNEGEQLGEIELPFLNLALKLSESIHAVNAKILTTSSSK